MDAAVWPEGAAERVRSVVTAAYLIVACTLSACLAKRFTTFSALKNLSASRLLVLAVLVDSVFIYLFLMERVHLVHCHTAGGRKPRLQSRWYRMAVLLFSTWIVVAILMIVGRIAYIRDHDGACVIGLKLYASAPMLAVDATVNLFLTSAFVIPIYRSKMGKAQQLARTSVISALFALSTSFINIVILALHHGKQLSFVCLGSCGIDVFLNASIIFYITSSGTKQPSVPISRNTLSASGASIDIDGPVVTSSMSTRPRLVLPATSYKGPSPFPGRSAVACPPVLPGAYFAKQRQVWRPEAVDLEKADMDKSDSEQTGKDEGGIHFSVPSISKQ
ncbi:hypothetical protein P7C70_g41, partial [Phenoliferia sp. Uapishka_3]